MKVALTNVLVAIPLDSKTSGVMRGVEDSGRPPHSQSLSLSSLRFSRQEGSTVSKPEKRSFVKRFFCHIAPLVGAPV